jgi:hypothetical protein
MPRDLISMELRLAHPTRLSTPYRLNGSETAERRGNSREPAYQSSRQDVSA